MKKFMRNYKAPFIVFVALLLVYLIVIGLTQIVAEERIDDHLALERERTENQISASINRYEVFSNYLNEELITDEVLTLMEQANSEDESVKNQAREDLETLLMEDYEVLDTYDFRQFHFHLPTGESFLRLHAPDAYGDMLFDTRESVRIVNTDQVYVSGFEEGRIYNGYRFIYPLFRGDTHIGSVEISVSYEAVLDTLYKVAPTEDAFFIIKESVVNESVFEGYETNYTNSTLTDDYLRDIEIFDAFRHRRYHFQGLELERFLASVQPDIKEDIERETSFSHAVECEDCDYVLHFISVRNVEDEHVGYLFTIVSDSNYTDLVQENRVNILFITIFFAMLLILMALSAKSRVELKKLSRKDPLTGLANRLFFTAQVEALLNSAKRNKTKLSLVMIDIDDFKAINDTFGHAEGDTILKELSNTFVETLRESDIIGRWGGEEFLIALPNTSEDASRKVAEKIRKSIKENVITKDESPITISLGVTTYGDENASFDTLVHQADTALYEAKKRGKDQVFVYKKEKDD
ncbi:MAG: diguanylate cyclase [Bacillota bacterium]